MQGKQRLLFSMRALCNDEFFYNDVTIGICKIFDFKVSSPQNYHFQ